MIENGFVHIPETAPWLAEYLHEVTVFPKGKHDDQVDSTAQFLDWFKRPFQGQAYFEYARMQAERYRKPENPERFRVLLRAPSGPTSVQTFSGRHIDVASDGTIEMFADDAEYLIRAGWAKLGEWTDEAAESEQIEQRNKPQGPKAVYAKGSVEWQQQQERETFARIAAAEEKERRRLARVAAVLGNKS